MRTVYRYKVYNINSDTENIAINYATEEFIKKIEGAKILFETELHIDDEQLDGNGIYKIVSGSDVHAND
jgi:hypothetical protein